MKRAITPDDLMTLSPLERLLLAQQLLDSVLADSLPLSSQQLIEVHRRAATIQADTTACEPWQLVKTRLLRSE